MKDCVWPVCLKANVRNGGHQRILRRVWTRTAHRSANGSCAHTVSLFDISSSFVKFVK
jgi:hypothetical protein